MKIYLTNLGKYNEGELVGEWLELPATEKEIEESFKRIGIDRVNYEEYFITDYEDSIFKIEEYSNLEFLNEIAEEIENLNDDELEAVEAFLDCIGGDILEAIEYIKKGEWYSLSNIENEYDLGYEMFQECYGFDYKDDIMTRYFDYKNFGNDLIMGDNWYLYEGKAYQFYY